MIDFGDRLILERKRLGLSQAEMAEIGGVGRSAQSRYEASNAPPNLEYLHAFDAAGGDVLYLVTGRRGGSGRINQGLLRALINRGVQERDARPHTNLQVDNLVVSLYDRIEPGLRDGDDVESIVDREVSVLMDIVRQAIPEEPSSTGQRMSVKGNRNQVAGRDIKNRGKK